jgi:hypothetical protein
MQRQKRQIIKTRPQGPYILARVILIAITVAVVALAIFELVSHHHPAHAATLQFLALSSLWQEGILAERMAPIRIFAERMRS